ncbi:MAG: right-handed parallel beta-helix repeat-containing protein [Deltaproteobacteria bacterium]|nr:right-handed parallel beta-helix repeat-containing protein [Deltaproteobacteria bacterium]
MTSIKSRALCTFIIAIGYAAGCGPGHDDPENPDADVDADIDADTDAVTDADVDVDGPDTNIRFFFDQQLLIPDVAEVGDDVGHAKLSPNRTAGMSVFTITAGNDAGIYGIDSSAGRIFIADDSGLSAGSNVLTIRVEDSVLGINTADVTVEVVPESTTVFIDPGNSGTQDGTHANPHDNIGDIGSMTEGHAYLIKRGTAQVLAEPFELGAPGVTIGAYGAGDRPYIEYLGDGHAIYNWSGPSGVTIRDIHVYAPDGTSCYRFGGEGVDGLIDNNICDGPQWGIRMFGYAGLVISYNEIMNIGDDGMFIQALEGIEIAHNHVHHVNDDWIEPYTPQEEASGDAVQLSDVNGWHVHHNLLDRTNSGNKFCFISNNAVLQDDGIFEHNRTMGPKTTGDGGASLYFANGEGLIIRHNVIEGPSCGALYHHSDNLEFYGNLVTGTDGGVTCLTDTPCVLENNTFHDVETNLISSGEMIVNNNIFSLTDGTLFSGGGSIIGSNNLFSSGTTHGANPLVGDPLFVDATGGDFTLQASSPAVDAGLDLGYEKDMDDNPIPAGTGPDIGAFELQP